MDTKNKTHRVIGGPQGPEYWERVQTGYSDMYAQGVWDWTTFVKMRDWALEVEQDDHRKLSGLDGG